MENYDKPEDICTHLGDDYDRYNGAIVTPLFQNTLFTRKTKDHGYRYTRVKNPTIEIAEQKIAALEGGEAALCLSSGMAAISVAVMHCMGKDGHIVCVKSAYPGTRELLNDYLPKFGIAVTYVTGDDAEQIARAIRPDTRLIYLESPSSLVFRLQDLSAVAALAKAHGIATVIDNTWSTPLFQNPLKFGIDIVVHSASKYLGGHSDILGGVIVSNADTIEQIARKERLMFGAVMDPHQAWLLIRSLRTLPVRMERHQANALKVAAFLENHPQVSAVLYPGLRSHPQYELGRRQMTGYSGLMSFIPKCTPEQALEMIHTLRMFEIGPSWGGFESLISCIPVDGEWADITGLPQGSALVRISVGLENVDSLIDDLDAGLSRLAK
jgi:cystathionine gamma-lyase